MNERRPSPEQRRAADALEALDEIQKKSENVRKRYRSYVERLGPAILTNGLGQALATERAAAGNGKNDDELAHKLLYDNVSRWLCRSEGVYANARDLLEAIINGTQEQYLRAQVEALRWIDWHKKFCQAYLPRPDES